MTFIILLMGVFAALTTTMLESVSVFTCRNESYSMQNNKNTSEML
ncbi:hypothetical protein [Vibrio taketomensis]|nr:hypothetical protein [Vibrio taketomensis]